MSTASLQIETSLRIAKPAHEVFEAIVNPEKMKHYFIAKSSGRLEEGKTVEWGFPEMEMTFPVQVQQVVPDKTVSFTWQSLSGKDLLVTINLQAVADAITYVTVTEGEEERNEQGIQWLKNNTAGWANFLACMKAYLEYGINLRKGAFDPSQMPA